ncbi:MAGa7180 family putative nuclease [Mesomycoplasma conjunctivae]|uniref:MAGa7180 family putative nuclease n=1 Tax=Mesomycoplasma conjunctivae TaxID=45361 RepID=UPI003DA4B3BC
MYQNRKFYKNEHYLIDKEQKVVILKPDFHQKLLNKEFAFKTGFKKVGGSLIGEVLGVDSYSSPFRAFIKIAKLDMPILDTKYIDAGQAIEPLVIQAISEAKGYEIEVFPPEKYNYDYFKDDPIVGGIPDGYIEATKTIIEIKTTGVKNFLLWGKKGENLPAKYLKQAQLYSYLKNVEDFVIVATFLQEDDYKDPKNFPIRQRKLRAYHFKVNKSQVIDDINKIKEWYTKYTNSGISPIYDEKIDSQILEYLDCENEQQWKDLYYKWINK